VTEEHEQTLVEVVPIDPPPKAQRVHRNARFACDGEKKNRYHLPNALRSGSPVGYRTRVSMSRDEVCKIIGLLDLERPQAFKPDTKRPTESEFFEERALGVLTSRQSTNFRGHRQVTLGPNDTQELASLLRELRGLDVPVLDHATYAHILLTRPYQTVFTLLLTFIGHKPITSLLTVAIRV
jgi:hypothetical protein